MSLKPGDLVILTDVARERFAPMGLGFVIAEVQENVGNQDVIIDSISDRFRVPHKGPWGDVYLKLVARVI